MYLSGLMARERVHNPWGVTWGVRKCPAGIVAMVDKRDRRKTRLSLSLTHTHTHSLYRRRTGGINRPAWIDPPVHREILFLRRLSMLSLTRKYCAVSFRARSETILLHAIHTLWMSRYLRTLFGCWNWCCVFDRRSSARAREESERERERERERGNGNCVFEDDIRILAESMRDATVSNNMCYKWDINR